MRLAFYGSAIEQRAPPINIHGTKNKQMDINIKNGQHQSPFYHFF